MTTSEELQTLDAENFSVSLDVNAMVESWLTRTVNSSLKRANDIRNDKSKAVFDFFDFCKKSAEQVLPADVEEWRWNLKTQKLADSTIYNRISALSQFYEYLRNEVGMMKLIPINPARVSLPKATKPFQSESVKALSHEESSKLLEVVAIRAQDQKPVHLRDNAILQFYVATGKRRAEITNLRGDSIEIKDGRFSSALKLKADFSLILNSTTKRPKTLCALILKRRVEPIVSARTLPLWRRHDKGAKAAKKKDLTSHEFVRRIDIYASDAGIEGIHIHRLRHTFAKIVSEYSESMAETQEALGHSHIKTTQIYVQRLAVKKDKHSKSIRDALKK